MRYEELIAEAKKVTGEFRLSKEWLSAGSCGAALLAGNKKIYTGICIDLACGLGFCAEHSAIAQMLKDRETKIIAIVATSSKHSIMPPCGRCREMMMQIDTDNSDTEVILAEDRVEKLRNLLPDHWL
jgi:cytidine deaminase